MELVDIVFHVHPDLSAEERVMLEKELGNHDGVISFHFDPAHAHLLKVAYNPEIVSSDGLLALMGKRGTEAAKVG